MDKKLLLLQLERITILTKKQKTRELLNSHECILSDAKLKENEMNMQMRYKTYVPSYKICQIFFEFPSKAFYSFYINPFLV